MFGLILMYLYSVFGFYFFDHDFIINDINFCTNLWDCYLTMIDKGLRNGGGIGDAILNQEYSSENTYPFVFRFFYDLFFFASINIVFLNIIFGIIVDTFALLREQKECRKEDMKNKCYICNIDRYTVFIQY